MNLSTDIIPRSSGEVRVFVPGIGESPGRSYVFVPEHSGALVCVVEDEAHVVFLLDTGNFYPANEKDMESAIKAVMVLAPDEAATAVKPAKKRK